MNRMKLVASVVLVATLAGCATRPANVAPAAVSTMRYDGATCRAMATEFDAVSTQLAAVSSTLETKANVDTAAVVVGALLFWPALFFMANGSAVQEAEVARLKGEQIALTTKMRAADCAAPTVAAK